MQQVKLGMVGGGTVGSGVFHALQQNGSLLASRIGVEVRVCKVAVKAFVEPRPYEIPESVMTTNWREVVEDPETNVIIELVGGTTLARTLTLEALRLGKPVITANKALLSAHGPELFETARKHNANLYYEASVCGGIPIIKSLREGFVGNRITHLYGIVNGTCNYILTRMKHEGAGFDAVLKDAQAQGYAEAEPSLDIDGFDAQHKTGILASLAHGFWVRPEQVFVEGIRAITATDIQFATQLGYTIKLLGIIKLERGVQGGASPGGTRIQVSVYPTLVPNSHVLANVNHVFNAVFVRGDVVGETLFYGRGAGKDATASAVLSDIADAALDLKTGCRQRIPPFVAHELNGAVLSVDEVRSRYFVRLSVTDKPGVLASIAAILGEAQIGIASVMQPPGEAGETVPLIFMLHPAPNGAVMKALGEIQKLPAVKAAPVMLRVENFD